MTATITELGAGWYNVGLTASHTDTAGILTCYFTHTSCKQVNIQFRVETRLQDDLAYPTTSGYSFDVTAAGNVGIDLDNVVGTLAKGTEITGFNDESATSVATAVWANATGTGVVTSLVSIAANVTTVNTSLVSIVASILANTTSLVSIAANTTSAISAASLALTAYDPPTKTELDVGLAALNDITVNEVWAAVADGSISAITVLKYLLSYVSGVVTKASTAFTYYDLTSIALWGNNVNAAWRRPV